MIFRAAKQKFNKIRTFATQSRTFGRKVAFSLGSIAVVATAFAVLIKTNKDFRNTIIDFIPDTESSINQFISTVDYSVDYVSENYSLLENNANETINTLESVYKDSKDYISQTTDYIHNNIPEILKSKEKPINELPRKDSIVSPNTPESPSQSEPSLTEIITQNIPESPSSEQQITNEPSTEIIPQNIPESPSEEQIINEPSTEKITQTESPSEEQIIQNIPESPSTEKITQNIPESPSEEQIIQNTPESPSEEQISNNPSTEIIPQNTPELPSEEQSTNDPSTEIIPQIPEFPSSEQQITNNPSTENIGFLDSNQDINEAMILSETYLPTDLLIGNESTLSDSEGTDIRDAELESVPPVMIIFDESPNLIESSLSNTETSIADEELDIKSKLPTNFEIESILDSLNGKEYLIEFSKSVHDVALVLGELLGKIPSNSAAYEKLETSRMKLSMLALLVNNLEKQETEKIDHALKEQKEMFNNILDEAMNDFYHSLSVQAADIASKYEEEMTNLSMKLKGEFDNELSSNMATQAAELLHDKAESLSLQYEEINAHWNRIVKQKVEEDRDGRLAKLDKLVLKVAKLEQIAGESQERLSDSVKLHHLSTALDKIYYLLNQNKHIIVFSKELEDLKSIGKDMQFVSTILNAIEAEKSKTGIYSHEELLKQFKQLRKRLHRIQLLPDDAGPISYAMSQILSVFMISKSGLVPGNDLESILSRAEYYMNTKDLDSATRELNQLKGWTRALCKDWLERSRERLEVCQALEIVETFIKVSRSQEP